MRRFSYVAGHPEDGPPPTEDEFEHLIEALDAETAAEEAAEDADQRDCSYLEEQPIWLKDLGTGEVSSWVVHRDLVPLYRATAGHVP